MSLQWSCSIVICRYQSMMCIDDVNALAPFFRYWCESISTYTPGMHRILGPITEDENAIDETLLCVHSRNGLFISYVVYVQHAVMSASRSWYWSESTYLHPNEHLSSATASSVCRSLTAPDTSEPTFFAPFSYSEPISVIDNDSLVLSVHPKKLSCVFW